MLFRVQHISRMFSFVAISLNDTRDTHTHFGCRSSCAKTTHSVTIHIWISIEFSLCKTIKCSTLYKYIYYIALLVHSVRIYFEHASAPLELGFNVRLWIYTRYKKRNPIKCNTVDYIANFFSLHRISNLRARHSKVLQCSRRGRPFSAIYRLVGIMQGKLSNFSEESDYAFIHSFSRFGEFALELVADNELEF